MPIWTGLLGLCVIVASGIIIYKYRAKLSNISMLLSVSGAALLGLGLLAGSCMVNIDDNHTGVVKLNGKVLTETISSGVHIINPFAEIIQIDTRSQSAQINSDETTKFLSADGKDLGMALSMSFHVVPETAPVFYAKVGPDNNKKTIEQLSVDIIRRKALMYDYSSLSTSKKEEFKLAVSNELSEELTKQGVLIEQLSFYIPETHTNNAVALNAAKEGIHKQMETQQIKPATAAAQHKAKSKPAAATEKTVSKEAAAAPIAKKKVKKVTPKDTSLAAAPQPQPVTPDTVVATQPVSTAPVAIAEAKPDTVPVNNVQVTPAPAPVVAKAVQPPPSPMDPMAFSALRRNLVRSKSIEEMITAANSAATTNYFNVAQVLSIVNTLPTKPTKLDFAKNVYTHTTNKKQYVRVIDAFKGKNRKMLTVHIMRADEDERNGIKNDPSEIATSAEENAAPQELPQLAAADCPALDDANFENVKQNISSQATEDSKLETAKTFSGNNCLTSSQVLDVVNMLPSPKAKYKFAKAAYAKTIDRREYMKVAETLKSTDRESLDKYIFAVIKYNKLQKFSKKEEPQAMPSQANAESGSATAAPGIPAVASSAVPGAEIPVPSASSNNESNNTNATPVETNTSSASPSVAPKDCTPMDDQGFEITKQSISQTTDEEGRVQTAKNIISGNCFTSEQVLSVLSLLSSPDKKLEIAKYSYGRTVDKRMFGKVAETFSGKYRSALDKYIMSTYASRN